MMSPDLFSVRGSMVCYGCLLYGGEVGRTSYIAWSVMCLENGVAYIT